jgi:hypothetical protein
MLFDTSRSPTGWTTMCARFHVISFARSLSHATNDDVQRLAYKVTYRRLRLKLDYPNHPYNSNTHGRKTFGVTVKINNIDDSIQWVEGVHHPAVRNFMIANGVQV